MPLVKGHFANLSCSAFQIGFDDGGGGSGDSFDSNVADAIANRKSGFYPDSRSLLFSETGNGGEGISAEGARCLEIMETFRTDLIKLETEIGRRNLGRRFPSNTFNPKEVLSSISV